MDIPDGIPKESGHHHKNCYNKNTRFSHDIAPKHLFNSWAAGRETTAARMRACRKEKLTHEERGLLTRHIPIHAAELEISVCTVWVPAKSFSVDLRCDDFKPKADRILSGRIPRVEV